MMMNVVREVNLCLQPCAAIIQRQSHLAALEPSLPLTSRHHKLAALILVVDEPMMKYN